MEKIERICQGFAPIQLEKMNEVKLMDRKEIKYTIHRDLLPLILEKIADHYYVLEIDGQNIMPYRSVYYDTKDYKFYTIHQNGKLNRYKVRNRTYELTGAEFLEIKFKNNKKRTIKNRIPVNGEGKREKDRASRDFLNTSLPEDFHELEEKLTVCYRRVMLVDHKKTERVTIDLNLTCRAGDRENCYDDMVVIEIKHEGELRDSAIARVLSDMRIKNISFSKYCLGISEMYGDVKKNRMKIKMRRVAKNLNSQTPHYFLEAKIS
ncbi:MAG: polyphosphate polymerase domain-containing protein [Spirochaetales bacterium]|nr:polyphosphate polymerase domain-containing protein [Spirochaetales bacterium]